MKFNWVDPKTLKPHPKNPNKHSQEQIKRLIKLIRAYGWRHPLIISNQSGFIIVGNGRHTAALEDHILQVPVHYQDFKDESEEYGFMVADNGISEWAELDLAAINIEIPSLGPNFDVDWLGLKDFELDPADKYSIDENDKALKDKGNTLEATFATKDEMMAVYQDLCDKGYVVKIKYV